MGACLLLLTAAAQAQPAAVEAPALPRLQLAPEQQLRAGSHNTIEVVVELPPGNDSPLLLTPSTSGSAVEVVRGRLSRSDGKVMDATHLRFEIPVRARTEGTAILRVEVMTYVCARTCSRVLLQGTQVLRVQGGE
jgi:hypothetical protein